MQSPSVGIYSGKSSWDVLACPAAVDKSRSVESQGRTLEELAWIYDQPSPVKASLKKDIVVLGEDGKVAEKIVE